MLKSKDELFSQAIETIEENEMIFFIEDVVSFVSCGKTKFYEIFPLGSDEMNSIKELLDDNKVKVKAKIRKKLGAGDKAAELLALYKLICTDEERKALSMQRVDHTSKGKRVGKAEKIIISTGNKKA